MKMPNAVSCKIKMEWGVYPSPNCSASRCFGLNTTNVIPRGVTQGTLLKITAGDERQSWVVNRNARGPIDQIRCEYQYNANLRRYNGSAGSFGKILRNIGAPRFSIQRK